MSARYLATVQAAARPPASSRYVPLATTRDVAIALDAGAVDATRCATVADAYAAGVGDDYYASRLRPCELRLARQSWRRAQHDHAETSWFGAAGVRKMRAYWVGVTVRARELSAGR